MSASTPSLDRTAGGAPDRPRDRILESARVQFEAEGERALSMRRVAEGAGVGTMSTYRHFENRDALIEALAQLGFDRFEQRYVRALDESGPAERLFACGEAYLSFALEHPRYYRLLFSADVTPSEAIVDRMRAAQRFLADRVRECVASAPPGPDAADRRSWVEDDEASAVALTLFSSCHGMVSLHLAGRFGPRLPFPAFFRGSLRRLIDGMGLPLPASTTD